MNYFKELKRQCEIYNLPYPENLSELLHDFQALLGRNGDTHIIYKATGVVMEEDTNGHAGWAKGKDYLVSTVWIVWDSRWETLVFPIKEDIVNFSELEHDVFYTIEAAKKHHIKTVIDYFSGEKNGR